MPRIALAFWLLTVLVALPAFSAPTALPAYRNPNLPVEQRVEDLLGRMTLQEKLNQLRSDNRDEVWKPAAQTTGFGEVYDILRPLGSAEAARLANRTQRLARRSRLRIPLIIRDEALHGLAGNGPTSFPQAIGMAATWDPAIVGRCAQSIAREAKARGVNRVLAPVINIARDARWGRVEETFGEDPLLQSRIAVEYVRGFETTGVATCPKHFVANVGDGGRDSHAIYLTEQALREVYLPPFEAAVKHAGARSIMTAYNSLNGRACSANHWLLTDLLKGEWGFTGVVGSDYGAAAGTLHAHRNAADEVGAAAANLNGGLDIEWPNVGFWGAPLEQALERGLVSEAALDDAVRRMLRNKFELGLFDSRYLDPAQAERIQQCPEHRAIALEAARKCLVLLRNRNETLPLAGQVGSIAVIGERAKDSMPLGGYSGYGQETVSVLDGLKSRLGDAVKLEWARGGQAHPGTTVPAIGPECYRDLRGEYFANKDLAGAPALVREDKSIDFDWSYASPAEGLGATYYSVRWTGKLLPPETGLLTFALTSDDGVRLYLDGDLVIDNWTIHAPTTDRCRVRVTQGRALNLKLEFYQAEGQAVAQLGWETSGGADPGVEQAAQLAARCDAAVVVVTIDEGEGRDRSSLDLPGNQATTIRAVAATGTPTIVILIAGAPVTMGDWLGDADAVLNAWYPGQEGGTAIAEALLGDFSPGGKLPITFPRSVGQCPIYYNLPPSGRGYDYVDLSGKPEYAFGHGLSYTTFAYSNLSLPMTARMGEPIQVSFELQNTGKVKGDEVAQLYIRDVVASMVRPLQELKAFERVTLEPGEKRTVTFTLQPDDLAFWNAQMEKVVEPGQFELQVGSSSGDIRLRATVEVG